jgi:hypothetical protein
MSLTAFAPRTPKHPCITAAILAISLFVTTLLSAQTSSSDRGVTQKESTVTNHATGTFDVKLTPQDDKSDDATLGRMTIDKQLHGDLEGTSKGQMLTAATNVKGSAAYVAIEKVTGTLNGRSGTFILQHNATMNRGTPHLSLTVVPDSGTGQLTGLSGSMTIKIADGKHSYEFDYTLVQPQEK